MPRFQVSHRSDGKFERRGLRSYFEYRDLGIKRATGGKVVAHVIRARPGKAPHGEWHYHDCGRPHDDEDRQLLLPAAAHPPSRAQAFAQPRDDRGRGAGELQDVGFT